MSELLRVLIVADSAGGAAAAEAHLRQTDEWSDAAIATALSHHEALRMLGGSAFDAALFARPLGLRDAIALQRDLRQRGCEIPIVVLNGAGSGAPERRDADAASVSSDERLAVPVESSAHDVADRFRLEEELRRSQKMEAVGQLAGGVAHDFNNLLTAILGYCNLMLDDVPEEDPLRHDLDEIRRAGERAAALTHQLLAFSRRQMLQPQIVNVSALVQQFEKMLRRLLGDDVALITALAPDVHNVKVDPASLEQVLANLAANARDAMPAGGTLIVETGNIQLDVADADRHVSIVPGPYVMIAVRDTGCGIDEETRAHIFEPFFTTKEQGRGDGLGLATVYGIVKQHGGYIWVDSEPDDGTAFRIYLPVAQG